MKKILKKLGVLGLIIAILAPFTKIPVVNAEETTNCSKHLQNYMFLDVIKASEIFEDDDPYTEGHDNYTVFPYAFPEIESSKVSVKSSRINYLTTKAQIKNYWELYDDVYEDSYINNDRLYSNFKYIDGKVFVNETDTNYSTNTILLHGSWSTEEANKLNIPVWRDYSSSLTVQNAMNFNNVSDVVITPAVYVEGNYHDYFTDSSENNLPDYFNDLVNKTYTKTGTVYTANNNNYIALKINRTLDSNKLNDLVFGYTDGSVIKVFSKDTTGKSEIDKTSIVDSFDAYQEYYEDCNGKDSCSKENYVKTLTAGKEEDLNFNTENNYYWPVVLNVVYEVCPLSDTTEEWTLTYHDNVNDAEITVPAQQKEKVGTPLKTSTTKPERSGYVFQKWCESANGSGQCYTAGQEVTSPEEGKDIPLFAIWGSTNTVDNPKQGVISYVIGFAAVGVVAGGIYLISKKKNLFKQI